MKKIIIAGPVGSGKTTFAKQLSAKKRIPYYELDNLIWNRHSTGDIPFPLEESTKKLQALLNKETWIIEGTTTKFWIKPALEDADIIFLLIPPYHVRVHRILSRYIKQITNQENAHYKPTLHLLKMMFIWNHHFEKKNFFELQKLVEPTNKKLIIVKKCNAYSYYEKNY
ncbi:hypothetical protein IGL98_001761 [Enterococcus sp. DIV0840]|uniref:hypothetical protein n=1 Tax=unclassified Enterococcus TaxID=2608891 RepID=UPI001A8E9583|nr:hypothetical protein [Enterococcus sp. DIV0849a]MBO0435097.1 hypothetical protein [Enterococcus sp. DIV0849a]